MQCARGPLEIFCILLVDLAPESAFLMIACVDVHSQACVLQDGRVLVAGGDDRDAQGGTAIDEVAVLRPPPLRMVGVPLPDHQSTDNDVSAPS